MTCENYNCTDANNVEREQERTLTLKNLEHVNYDHAKSDRNVVLEHDSRADQFKTFRAYVKDYKEQEHKRLVAKNEKLKAISKELDKAYEQSEKAYHYNLKVERYCQEQSISIVHYEKQCFWADRDWGNYSEPERHNPDRCIEPERDAPTHSRMEHER